MDAVTLFCFAPAGATTFFFRTWQRELRGSAVVVPVPYARGAGGQSTLSDVVAHASALIGPAGGPDVVFYGHSMGAMIAFELCLLRLRAGLPSPRALIVGAAAPPGTVGHRELCLRAARSISASRLPDAVRDRTLEHLRMLGRHVPSSGSLDVPVVGFAGTSDPLVSPQTMRGWSRTTSSWSAQHRVPGSHLFPRDRPQGFFPALIAVLSGSFASPPAA